VGCTSNFRRDCGLLSRRAHLQGRQMWATPNKRNRKKQSEESGVDGEERRKLESPRKKASSGRGASRSVVRAVQPDEHHERGESGTAPRRAENKARDSTKRKQKRRERTRNVERKNQQVRYDEACGVCAAEFLPPDNCRHPAHSFVEHRPTGPTIMVMRSSLPVLTKRGDRPWPSAEKGKCEKKTLSGERGDTRHGCGGSHRGPFHTSTRAARRGERSAKR